MVFGFKKIDRSLNQEQTEKLNLSAQLNRQHKEINIVVKGLTKQRDQLLSKLVIVLKDLEIVKKKLSLVKSARGKIYYNAGNRWKK